MSTPSWTWKNDGVVGSCGNRSRSLAGTTDGRELVEVEPPRVRRADHGLGGEDPPVDRLDARALPPRTTTRVTSALVMTVPPASRYISRSVSASRRTRRRGIHMVRSAWVRKTPAMAAESSAGRRADPDGQLREVRLGQRVGQVLVEQVLEGEVLVLQQRVAGELQGLGHRVHQVAEPRLLELDQQLVDRLAATGAVGDPERRDDLVEVRDHLLHGEEHLRDAAPLVRGTGRRARPRPRSGRRAARGARRGRRTGSPGGPGPWRSAAGCPAARTPHAAAYRAGRPAGCGRRGPSRSPARRRRGRSRRRRRSSRGGRPWRPAGRGSGRRSVRPRRSRRRSRRSGCREQGWERGGSCPSKSPQCSSAIRRPGTTSAEQGGAQVVDRVGHDVGPRRDDVGARRRHPT